MSRTVLINAGAVELRTAVVEDGRLQELYHDRPIGIENGLERGRGAGQSFVGNIFLGRVLRVMPGMQAAFVDVGLELAGFLAAREARGLTSPCTITEQASLPSIGDCVREGEDVLVQVIKHPIGDKGVRLSAGIAIPGRLLVLLPQRPGIALSRRIEDDAERARLTVMCEETLAQADNALLPNAGYIVRSAAAGADRAELRGDGQRLADTWLSIMAKRKIAGAPALLHHDLAPLERIMRDKVTAETVSVLIDDRTAFEAARGYCRRFIPEAEPKLELFRGPGSLFEACGVEDDIAALISPRVALPSGGWITIEGTEALTAVDVNSGSFTAATGLEETSLTVNLEAAWELGRQLRLRGIGGLIVVDFIHLANDANVERLLAALAENVARDGAPTQISPMSPFGLVEIARKRVREPLGKRVTETCHACDGLGRRRTRESVALDLLREGERAAAAAPGRPVVARAAPDVVRWLCDHDDEVRAGLARRGAARVTFEAREEYKREGYDVTTG